VRQILIAAVIGGVALLIAVVMSRAPKWQPHGRRVATDIIHVPQRCQIQAIMAMHGQRESELNAYVARQIEAQLVKCGATVERAK